MAEKLISELLDLPESVRKGDFVLNLSQGVNEPAKTLEQYVVTPQLVECFRDALGFIRSSVDAGNSKACYLHGSFGSGKSHFMAVLHLLLSHEPTVRGIKELAPVVAENQWVGDKKFLLVPYHMIGARNMESAILGGYVEHVSRHHPNAPLPGVYLADDIFANAVQFRESLGDDKFFAKLNEGQTTAADSRRGKLNKGWDAARFEAALKAPPANEERSRLVGDLVQRMFPAFKGIANGKDESYVDLDQGLAVISAHAKSLGYDALILFLDELILWLASRSANTDFLQQEGQKLAKLVESKRSERPAPIISFVARQRDLRELVGENVTGAGQLNFSDVLTHWEGRFHTIKLEDRNLPVIAQRRVLKPKNEAAGLELQNGFDRITKIRTETMEVLLTRDSDRAMFKMVYPFSPALIQALVAVSSALQRERTALKIMLQMLVNRRDTLRIGDVIPLGDLWDVVAHGDEAFTNVMRTNFENARRLYQQKLRPMLEQRHGVEIENDRERAKTDPKLAQKVQIFDNDDRLIKSLLLSALVHGVEALQNMTCSRLAALNHGAVRAIVEGREYQQVATKVRDWAGIVGEIRVSADTVNPTVSIQLTGVDTESIIQAAQAFDNAGNRQRKIREMLFKSFGVEDGDNLFTTHEFTWRGTARQCDVQFANVRELVDDTFRSTKGWKLIVDFPFDSEGHSADDDLERLAKFRNKGEKNQTIIWLPSFFSTNTQKELGKLVIIDRLLLGHSLEQHAKHLSANDQQTARLLLENQQSALSQRLMQAVEAAYALRNEPSSGMLDASIDMSESHFQSLYPSLRLETPVGANLGEALNHLLDQALSHQYPKHPKFGQEIKYGKDLKQVLEVCIAAAQSADGRYFVEDKTVRTKVRNICNPLELGQMSETHFVLSDYWKNHFKRLLAASGQPRATVDNLRSWTDQPEERGLPSEIQDLLILTYAEQTTSSFVRHNTTYEPSLNDLPGILELVQQNLPDLNAWNEAVKRVDEMRGCGLFKSLNASNLGLLATKYEASVKEYRDDCIRLPAQLQLMMRDIGIDEKTALKSNRLRTALATRSLLKETADLEPTELVGVIAKATLETSVQAMGTSINSAPKVLECLIRTKWTLFDALNQIEDERQSAAQLLLEDVRLWLKTDELAVASGIAKKLEEAEGRAIKLLTPPKKPTPPQVATPVVQPQTPTPVTVNVVPDKAPVPMPPPVTTAPGWKFLQRESLTCQSEKELRATLDELVRRLKEKPGRRLTLDWKLEEES